MRYFLILGIGLVFPVQMIWTWSIMRAFWLRLREVDPEKWKLLGQPDGRERQGVSFKRAQNKFIKSKVYKDYSDSELNHLAARYRVAGTGMLVSATILAFLVLIPLLWDALP